MDTQTNPKKTSRRNLNIISVILIILLAYILVAKFFESHFLPNTRLYSVNIAFKNEVTATEKIKQDLSEANFSFISENDDDLGHVQLKNLGLEINCEETMDSILKDQNSWSWPISFFDFNKNFGKADQIKFNTDLTWQLVDTFQIDNSKREPTQSALLVILGDGEYDVTPEVYGNQITGESLAQAMAQTISQGEFSLKLDQAYVKPEFKADDNSLDKQIAEINQMPNVKVTLDLDGAEVTVPSDVIKDAIIINEYDGLPDVDTAVFEEFLAGVNEEYAGINQYHDFESTQQGVVSVQPGTYGWYIDTAAEAQEIRWDILEGESVTREPVILGDGYKEENYFGPTYVEVDLTYQTMFIYQNHELVLQTPIVSGITGSETIPGAYQVWNKESPSVLTGYNPLQEKEYETPVTYWIAFDDQAQGIHDASWQSSFGGNVHISAGSLGCINTPPNVMEQVYELVDYGTPVVIF